ncbi:MAG: 2,3-bisphosphoglycerate-independent phosphoglycerate mutase [Acidobacteria bacterium]|nr:2,3-bisphosphoglycerate-independent phosphoglycerate mutase [Acidobacteriota bacterium]
MNDDQPQGSRGRRKKGTTVICSAGSRSRFLRGMITHDLVKRGLDFDVAYSIAQTTRDAFDGRAEVTTQEIREAIAVELGSIGEEALVQTPEWHPTSEVRVTARGQDQPFSKGLLAETLEGAGVELGHAYRIVAELEAQLHDENVTLLSSGEVARRIDDLLTRHLGAATARRYRVLRNIHRLPLPVVVYIAGASGTGKSSLALELAPLLRIYRVSATDTIRQVMRMVFTPGILPALHRSSFELASPPDGEPEAGLSGADGDDADRVIASYEEQTARVLVGVRAVVERAIAERMSIIVEGVHLRPGSVPFPDLEGSCYQVPIVLGSLDQEAHRRRLLGRSHGEQRRAERYVAAFSAIRTVNDHLLDLAEANDIPMLDTFRDEEPEARAVQLLVGALTRRAPGLTGRERLAGTRSPALLLIIDGLADRPVRALGGRTPLQAATTPTLDRLANEGRLGIADPVGPGIVPDTAAGTLALFGQSPAALKRGPVEALGAGIRMSPDDIALRANLATLDENGTVVDRRAGRVRDEAQELARALDRIELPGELGKRVSVRVKAGTEHRLAVLLRGQGLSSGIEGSDPGDAAIPGAPLEPKAQDPGDEMAAFTAEALAAFEKAAQEVLAEHPANRARAERGEPLANILLTRGAGRIHRLVNLEDAGWPLRLCCIGGDRTVLGLARWLGADIVSQPGMTSNLDTDLDLKFAAARESMRHNDLTVMHIKGADIAAHDRRPDLKAEFLERLDTALDEFLASAKAPMRVAVASDHATLSESGQHGADPLPVLIWDPDQERDEVDRYDEQSAANGALGRFPLQNLLGKLFEVN